VPKHQEIFISPRAESLVDAMNISHKSPAIKITENGWQKCKSGWERQRQYVSKDSKLAKTHQLEFVNKIKKKKTRKTVL